jgi:hypothetical protein
VYEQKQSLDDGIQKTWRYAEMKYLGLCMLLSLMVACGSNDDSNAPSTENPQNRVDQAATEAEQIVDDALSGEKPDSDSQGAEGCEILESGLVPDHFGVDPAIVNYRSSVPVRSAGHVVCSAFWDKPNKAELDQAYTEALMEWTQNKVKGEKTPMPKPVSGESRVSLTLVADSFDSSDAAVANLESAVETLSKGISVEVGGKTHETKMSFGEWIDGLGDAAIFSEKGELLVAAKAKRFSVNVEVTGDDATDRATAMELARKIIDML